MLRDFLEPYLRLEKTVQPDGHGGVTEQWREGDAFLAGIWSEGGSEAWFAGSRGFAGRGELVYESGLALNQHDRVMRSRDGCVYRVIGPSRKPPEAASFACMCAPVEMLGYRP